MAGRYLGEHSLATLCSSAAFSAANSWMLLAHDLPGPPGRPMSWRGSIQSAQLVTPLLQPIIANVALARSFIAALFSLLFENTLCRTNSISCFLRPDIDGDASTRRPISVCLVHGTGERPSIGWTASTSSPLHRCRWRNHTSHKHRMRC